MTKHSGRYFDRQEVRDPAERERTLFHALPGLLHHAIENTSYFADALKNIRPNKITSRAALASLPILRKDMLLERQRQARPFGGLAATAVGRMAHIYWSPGPIYDPEGARSDYWRFARALFAAGIRSRDLVYNTFSYHMTPAGLMIDAAARSLGCPVFPAGTGQTDRQIEILSELRPTAYVGTPSFLLILLQRAKELGIELSGIQKAVVSGEAFAVEMRNRLQHDHNVDAYQCYGTADVGLIAYESEARDGLIADESLILEIVRPGSATPVEPGEVGEIVVTMFNPDYPLIRFATGDMTKQLSGESPCGRTNMRIAGWMGRADQRTKVRGMFVDPRQVNQLAEMHDMLRRLRLIVDRRDGRDELLLKCEMDAGLDDIDAMQATLIGDARRLLGLRCDVDLVEAGSLPNDGKVIDDRRTVS